MVHNLNELMEQIFKKFNLIKIYMETRNMNASDVLKLTVAELILTYKNFDVTGLFNNSVLNASEKKQFIDANIELFKKWDQFLASTMVFLVKSFPDLNEAIKILYDIYDKGYSVMDILDNYFLFVKITNSLTETQKYEIIPNICKYITIFHNIHEDEIELALFSNNLFSILAK
jgi:hypothetical protein